MTNWPVIDDLTCALKCIHQTNHNPSMSVILNLTSSICAYMLLSSPPLSELIWEYKLYTYISYYGHHSTCPRHWWSCLTSLLLDRINKEQKIGWILRNFLWDLCTLYTSYKIFYDTNNVKMENYQNISSPYFILTDLSC